jgi:folate-binding protein YgfZ
VRHAAGFIDRSARGRIAVGGRDRAAFLQGLLTNDIAAITPARGCYALWLTPQGRLIADMRVVETGDALVLDLEPGLAPALLARLDSLVFTEDVRLEDLTGAWGAIGVHGPAAGRLVAAAISTLDPAVVTPPPDALAGWREYQVERVAMRGAAMFIVGARDTGERGFDLLFPGEWLADARAALERGGGVEVDASVAEVLRVEAGRPRFGADVDTDTIPLEAGLEDRAISFTKGCYVGQEVIIRVLHRGHGRVARKLVGLIVDEPRLAQEGRESPEDGDRVQNIAPGDVIEAGGKVGRVTSAGHSPALGVPIALGYVPREAAEPGTVVEIVRTDRRWRARVTSLPFVPPATG